MMAIEYLVNLFLCEVGLLLLFLPFLALGSYLDQMIPEASILRYPAMAYVFLMIGLYVFGISYFAHDITRRKVFENKTFRASLSETICEIRIFLAFAPIIGGWFQQKKGNSRINIECRDQEGNRQEDNPLPAEDQSRSRLTLENRRVNSVTPARATETLQAPKSQSLFVHLPLVALLAVASVTNCITTLVHDTYVVVGILYFLIIRFFVREERYYRYLVSGAIGFLIPWFAGGVLPNLLLNWNIGLGTIKLMSVVGLALGIKATLRFLLYFAGCMVALFGYFYLFPSCILAPLVPFVLVSSLLAIVSTAITKAKNPTRFRRR